MDTLTTQAARQLRGLLLRLVYVNHNTQASRTNSTLLWAVVQREGYDFTRDDVLTMLQDLRERGYIRYEQHYEGEGRTRRLRLFNIEMAPAGRDIIDGLKADAAVQVD